MKPTRTPEEESAQAKLALAQNPVFAALDEELLARIISLAPRHNFSSGETLMLQGDNSQRLYLIVSGTVRVLRRAAAGSAIELGRRGVGELVGEVALFDDGPRTASIVATNDVSALIFERELFMGIISRNAAAMAGLLRLSGQRIRGAVETASGLSFLDVRERVARAILQLSALTDDSHLLKHNRVTQSELAEMVSGTRQTVNKALQLLQIDGLISVDNDGIRVLNRFALQRLTT